MSDTNIMDQVIGTEAGTVSKRFESWDDASEWEPTGEADWTALP